MDEYLNSHDQKHTKKKTEAQEQKYNLHK